MSSFEMKLAELKHGVPYMPLRLTLHGKDLKERKELVEEFLSPELNYGTLFAYLFRRFGYPNHGWDDYKELTNYYLSTPEPDMVMCVRPYVGDVSYLMFSFYVPKEVFEAINDYEIRDILAYKNRKIKWLKENVHPPGWMRLA